MINSLRHRLVFLLAVVLFATACDKPDPDRTRQNRSAQTQTDGNEFSLAAEYLQRFSEYEVDYGRRNMLYHLNQWITEQPTPDDWQADPLAGQLPAVYRDSLPPQFYQRHSFDMLDGMNLWEAAMIKRISTWALDDAHDDPLLTDWYAAMEGTHGADHVHRLQTAARLFDWTVRNIQLDPLLSYPPDTPIKREEDSQPIMVPPPLRGMPGPGYRFYPQQVLLYGRGDAWQRARVFIRLARQQNLDVVMLAVDSAEQLPQPRPWLPALLLDDQLYLFDTALGLPLPGDDYTGIATLADLIAQPELLEQYKAPDHEYPITAEQLQEVQALIDASPSELSHRMQLVESNLIGQQKLHLTVDPSSLAKRLRASKGISNVRIWPIAVETILYQAIAPRVAPNPQLQADLIRREKSFETLNPMTKGRWQHLAGNFDSAPRKTGAKELYLAARYSEATIAIMAQSPQIQREIFGRNDGLSDDPKQREAQLRENEQLLLHAAQNASYWLGLINYAEAKPEVALDWLQRQTLQSRNETVWKSGAGYNVGRCYEQLGEYEKALANYRTQEPSPSQAGQLVRAKWLEARFAN